MCLTRDCRMYSIILTLFWWCFFFFFSFPPSKFCIGFPNFKLQNTFSFIDTLFDKDLGIGLTQFLVSEFFHSCFLFNTGKGICLE